MLEMNVEQRVTDLEELMAQVLRTIDRVDHQVDQTQRQVDQTQRQVDQTQRQVDQTSQELRASYERSEAMIREMNRKWGELANKMGTMAEDLVAPSVPRILRETVGCPDGLVESIAVRVRRLHPTDRGRSQEFDVVAVCGEHVLINETKSNLNPRDMEEFAQQMAEARDFFPEYADKKFIGAIASLYVDESVARYGEKQGLIVLGFGEDVMEVLNSPGFVPKSF
jgi:hypothetical protein